ncbi:uncharacterized protein V3H82_003100 [Fundulus diaphanus]
MASGTLIFISAVLTATAAAENLTRKAGEDVTFSLGHRELKDGDHLVWSGPNDTVLFNIYIGEDIGPDQSSRFKLNLTTGSFTIRGLLPKDTGVYNGKIFNGKGTDQQFNLTVEAATAAAENLTRKAGEDVTFSLGHRELKDGDHLVWSGPNDTVLFNIYIGDDIGPDQSSRFKLNLTTGSFTIRGLLPKDTGVYNGKIFNGKGTDQQFNLTVEEPDPIPPNAESHTGTIVAAVVAAGFAIVVFAVFGCRYLIPFIKKRKTSGQYFCRSVIIFILLHLNRYNRFNCVLLKYLKYGYNLHQCFQSNVGQQALKYAVSIAADFSELTGQIKLNQKIVIKQEYYSEKLFHRILKGPHFSDLKPK